MMMKNCCSIKHSNAHYISGVLLGLVIANLIWTDTLEPFLVRSVELIMELTLKLFPAAKFEPVIRRYKRGLRKATAFLGVDKLATFVDRNRTPTLWTVTQLLVWSVDELPEATEEQLNEFDDVCAICAEPIASEARVTPCGHLFHTGCLREAVRRNCINPCCPMCRCPLND